MKNLIKATVAAAAILAIMMLSTGQAQAHMRKTVLFRHGFKVVKTVRYNPHNGCTVIKKIRTHLRSGRRVKIIRRIDPWGNVRVIRKTLRPAYGYYPRKTHHPRRAARWGW